LPIISFCIYYYSILTMIRFKSVDTFRGICMTWMYLGHLLEWWIKPEYLFINTITHQIFDSVGASGFLLVSGLSMALSYRRKSSKYFLRAFFLLIIAILYNVPTAIKYNNFFAIWIWFVLLTAAFSLILAWPLLKAPIYLRLIIGFSIWFANSYLFMYLSNFKGEYSINGVIYYILYNEPQLDPLSNFFPFFLFGTVLGEMIFRLDLKNDKLDYKKKLKKNLIIPLIIIGMIFIIFGVIYNYPQFFTIRGSLAWDFYSLGIEIILLMIFFSIEFLLKYKTKKSYRFLFYFSYYSFTVYLVHQLLYFLLLGQLDDITIWFAIPITFIISGLILRIVYRHIGPYASIKALISKFSTYIARKKYVE
jgi:hypothetical protein